MVQENEDIPWNDELEDAWKRFQKLLNVSARESLHQINPNEELGIVSDASEKYWSAIIFQCEPITDEQKTIKLTELTIRPIMFLSGKFIKSQRHWDITQKELYPIIKTML